jgi:hypothetical protein
MSIANQQQHDAWNGAKPALRAAGYASPTLARRPTNGRGNREAPVDQGDGARSDERGGANPR